MGKKLFLAYPAVNEQVKIQRISMADELQSTELTTDERRESRDGVEGELTLKYLADLQVQWT